MVKNIKEGTKYNEKKVQDKKWTKNKIVWLEWEDEDLKTLQVKHLSFPKSPSMLTGPCLAFKIKNMCVY